MTSPNGDDTVDELVVKVRPDLTGFRAKLDADLKNATKNLPNLKVKLVADATGFNASAKAELAKQAALKNRPEYKISLVADAQGFNASARAALAKLPTVEHKVRLVADFDAKDLRGKVVAAADSVVDAKVTIGTDFDEQALRGKVSAAAAAAGQNVTVGVEADPEHLAASVKAALLLHSPYKIKVDVDVDKNQLRTLESGVQKLGGANSSLSQLLDSGPKLINFGGEGIRPFNLLITAALALTPLLVAVGSSAIQAGASLTALGAAGIGAGVAIGGVAIAFQGVLAALKLRKTVQAEQLQTAANANAAQATELKNEQALHAARVQSARDLENLKQKFIDLHNEQMNDTLTLAEARDKAAATNRNFFASSLEKQRSSQDVRNAVVRLSDTNLDLKQNKEDLANFNKKGIEGQPGVVAAKAALKTPKISSPAAQLQAQLAKLSPAARQLYNLIDRNQKVFDLLGRRIQQKVLPGFVTFLKQILKVGKNGKSSLSIFADAAGDLGKIVGDLAGDLGKLTRTTWFRKDFKKIIGANKDAMKTFAGVVIKLVKPFTTIFADSAPLLKRFADFIDRAATSFADFIDRSDKSGKLKKFFDDSATTLGKWATLAGNISRLLLGIFTGSAPAGTSVIDRLNTFFKAAADWANSPKGQKAIKDFFDKLAGLNYRKIGEFVGKLTIMFGAALAAKFALANPFFTAIGLLAASNPDKAIAFMDAMTNFLVNGLGYLAKHKDQAELFLAILAAGRAVKTFAAIRLAVSGLAVSGTVTAAALLVPTLLAGGPGNILKGLESIPKGIAADPKHPDEMYKQWSAQARKPIEHWFAVTLPQIMTAGGDNGWSSFKSAFYNTFGDDAAHFFSVVLPNALNPGNGGSGGWAGALTNLGHFFSTVLPNSINLGVGEGGWAGLARNVGRWFSMTLPNAITGGSNGWAGLGPYAWEMFKKNFGIPLVGGLWEGIKEGGSWLWQKLKGWAASFWSYLKDLFTVHSPARNMIEIGMELINGLWQGFVDRWNALSSVITGWIKSYITTPLVKVFTALGNTLRDAFTHPFTTLITALAKPVKAAFDWIDVNLIAKLNVLLSKIGVPTIPLIGFSVPASTAPAVGSVGGAVGGALAGVLKRADGGPVPGYSPNKRADNIPAMLTADEFVQPVDAVRHYGVGFMESVRRRQFPRYADGGLVGGVTKAAPGLVGDIVKAGFRAVQDLSLSELAGKVATTVLSNVFGGSSGVAVGDVNVAETAESTARSLGATDKQLLALIEAGIVESGLRNLTSGDRDSAGFLQQRPSQGWGSAAQVQNVAYATTKFIQAAKNINSKNMTAGQLAQAVQRSAAGQLYDQRQGDAIAVLNRSAPFYSVGGAGGGVTPMFGGWPGSPAQDHGHDSGVWRKIISLVAATGLDRHSYGSLYDNRRTDNGGWSWHADGRAVDFGGFNQDALAEFFEARRPAVLELIHRTDKADYGIKRGQPHDMGGEFAKHKNHLHVAMADGGRVRKYDTGGYLPPGYTLAYNGTGRNETIRTYQQEKQISPAGAGAPMRLDRRDMVQIASYIAGATSPTVQMDGREVAKITNRYTYLPVGL